jgi:hypothetical protein
VQPITRRMLGVDLDGSGRIQPAHVGWPVGPDGSRRILALAGRQGLCHAAAMARLRVATWNIAGARREQTNQVDLDAVVAGVRALGVDLLAVQEVDRQQARSDRTDQPTVIAQALEADWFWSYAPASSTPRPC